MAMFGFYPGYGLNRVQAITEWLGQPQFLQLHGDKRTWADFVSSMRGNIDESEKLTIDEAKKLGVRLQITQPGFIEGANLKDAAAGKYNTHYEASAKAINEALGLIDYQEVFRTFVEWNGRWMPWQARNEAEAKLVAAAFRHYVTLYRKYRPKAIIDWNYNRAELNPLWGWPGDEYVDVISWDGYIEAQHVGNEDGAKVFERFRTEPYGLDWCADLARQKKKKMAISETGLKSCTDAQGVSYLKAMTKWILANLDVVEWVSPFLEKFDFEKLKTDPNHKWNDVELRATGQWARPNSQKAMRAMADAIKKTSSTPTLPPVTNPPVTEPPSTDFDIIPGSTYQEIAQNGNQLAYSFRGKPIPVREGRALEDALWRIARMEAGPDTSKLEAQLAERDTRISTSVVDLDKIMKRLKG